MNTRSSKTASLLLVATISTALSGPLAASEPDAEVAARGCAAQFEKAQRQDMESFRDYDAKEFRDVHHPDAVTIFASGHVFYGLDEIMRVLASHFENREAVWAWTELYRIVELEVDLKTTFSPGAPGLGLTSTFAWGGFDRSLDGQSFIAPRSPTGSAQTANLLIVQNWFQPPSR